MPYDNENLSTADMLAGGLNGMIKILILYFLVALMMSG